MEIKRILLVDDEEDIRTVGSIALRKVGKWETLLADSGEAAVEIVIRSSVDIVLLDVMMPGMDGPTTLKRLRANPATAAVPVIFLTAKVQRQEVQRYLELGALGVIAKPFDPMHLPDEILRIAEGV